MVHSHLHGKCYLGIFTYDNFTAVDLVGDPAADYTVFTQEYGNTDSQYMYVISRLSLTEY